MTSEPSKRARASVLGVPVGVLFLLFSIASILIGLSISSVFVLAPVVIVVALSVVALATATSKTQQRLARLILATTGLCVLASVAYTKLLRIELDLVSESRSPDLAVSFGWFALAVAVAAYVGLLVMGARLLTQPPVTSAAEKP